MSSDLITGGIAFIFTLLIFSYLIGDNPLFRVAVYIFVGVSAGYVASVAWHQVVWPGLFRPLLTGTAAERLLAVVPLLLAVLLLMKMSPRLSPLGAPAMAYLVGVGAAVAVGGAVLGTLLPQAAATVTAFDIMAAARPFERLFEASIFLTGTVTTLVYFHFGARPRPEGGTRRNVLIEALAWIGRVFLAITFGTLFAGVYAAALAALLERLSALALFLGSL